MLKSPQFSPIFLLKHAKYISRKCIYTLGIETSCDDTGVAIMKPPNVIVGQKLISQTELSVKLGGVLPSIAAELHAKQLNDLVKNVIKESMITETDLSCIAVTVKPGMPLSLKIGVSYAKNLAKRLRIPIIPVHHMEAHALTALLTDHRLKFPYIIVLLSGGHALIGVTCGLDEFILLGTALDACPGDVLDKLARRLKLSRLNNADISTFSGGRSIEYMALTGDPNKYQLPLTRSNSRDCDISFTGLQIAAEKLIKDLEMMNQESIVWQNGHHLPINIISDVCASIQFSMARLICRRVQRAIEFTRFQHTDDSISSGMMEVFKNVNALVVSGGVGANTVIRASLNELASHYDLKLIAPPSDLCTDNGVMIAWNGLLLFQAGLRITHDIDSIDFESKVPFGMNYRNKVKQLDLKIIPIKPSISIASSRQ